MQLYELLENNAVTSLPDQEITGLTDDSRKIQPGMVFACIRGEHFDGHNAAAEMLERGAAAVLVDHDLGLGDRQILTEDTRALYGKLCAAWFGHPERKMHFVGVTGTNGKTTITNLIKHILTKNGHTVGLIGTIQNEIGSQVVHTDNTTPFVYDLMALYRKMADAGCDYVVMEVSSFGLVQQRIGDTHFDAAVFTNLTQDHLDYHGTMEQYYQAKKLLFFRCDQAVIDTDDSYGERLFGEIACPGISYGSSNQADFYADAIKLRADGTSFWLCCGGKSYPVNLHLTGMFNVSNALAAVAACHALGMPLGRILSALETCTGVRGRCEVIPTDRDFTVICDYAHTPDAVENILRSVKEYTKGRLICLFGCGGNRDATKRPKMAQAAAKYADFLMVTSDNPRDEDPEAIIADILTGLEGSEVPYEVVVDRKEAILRSMQLAQPGDVIVLAGKGHEDYQVLPGGVHIHMDEREIVRECLPLVPKR
ncbi:UDP-N-acetylmuramoyl-L-alanyl-D-glutamate--2,6-diaminopimelate ligase [uncultured Ruminococcus sp.]|uniref:UDP-N-acetylmuramoyl-L-alanyl-D-glutamate--2, 6-diaminopimelate ligase n=1 Tax=uncultured Ruminococcus sp. TaxID=165186 RepID=UPI002619A191|nr:UDP-N-acetylmuramoyl-L-alanyl-D-glutamate--2,6-diaminopimelate ligase [uncultured Ruminococcus sp.]